MHEPECIIVNVLCGACAAGLACGCSGWRWQLQDLVQQHKLKPDFIGDTQQPAAQQEHQQQHMQTLQQPQQATAPRLSDPDAQHQWQQEVSAVLCCGVQPVVNWR